MTLSPNGKFEILVDRATYDDMMDEMFEEIKKKLNEESTVINDVLKKQELIDKKLDSEKE